MVNRTDAESAVSIVAIAIARHRDGSEAQTMQPIMEINADESVTIEAAPPLSEAPDAAESSYDYESAPRARWSMPIRRASCAVIRPAGSRSRSSRSGVLVDGEDTVPGFASSSFSLGAG